MSSQRKYGAKSALRKGSPESESRKAIETLWPKLVAKHMMPVFEQTRTGHRVMDVLATMILMDGGKKTIANTIVARGLEQKDWGSDFRAFSRGKWDPAALFHGVFEAAVPLLPKEGPIVLAIDDTALPKYGQTISYTRFVHNPLCPRWVHPAIQWGLPEFHAVLIIPTREVHRPTAITVAFEPIPSGPKKKSKKHLLLADGTTLPARKRGRPTKKETASRVAAEGICGAQAEVRTGATWIAVKVINRIRMWLDEAGLEDRPLLVVGDGSYCNGTVICHLPERTEFIGRTREEARLCSLSSKLRKGGQQYGGVLPTPKEMATDDSIHEATGSFHYSGDVRPLKFKGVSPVYWRSSTKKKPLTLLILQPVPYGKGEKRGYNRRAYLLSTILHPDPIPLIQAYLDRWQIEVLHRDLKSGVGLGQAQVKLPQAVERVHSGLAAMYALLVIATLITQGQVRTDAFGKSPKWRTNHKDWLARKRISEGKTAPVYRPSVADITGLIRMVLARKGTGLMRWAA